MKKGNCKRNPEQLFVSTLGIKRNTMAPWKGKRPVGRPPGNKKNNLKITEKEQLFANLILENMLKTRKTKMSNTQAYRIAFNNYKCKESSAQVMASILLKSKRVNQYIQSRKKAAANRVEISVSRVLKGLLRIAEFDPRNFLDSKGRPIPIHKLPDDLALGSAGMEFNVHSRRTPTGQRKLTYYPKNIKHEARKPAWELIGQHLNMFDGNEQEETAQDFIKDIRSFADEVTAGIPGGKI